MRRDPLAERMLATQQQYAKCEGCELHVVRKSPVYGSWADSRAMDTIDSTLMFVFDRQDVTVPRVHRVPAGSYKGTLRYLLSMLDTEIGKYWGTSTAFCPTADPNPNDWPPVEMLPMPKRETLVACRPRLHAEILALEPEVIVAFGKVATDALWTKNPPKFQGGKGDLHELTVRGGMTERVFPVMFTNSVSALYREEDYTNGGIWNKTYDHIATARSVGEYLRSQRAQR